MRALLSMGKIMMETGEPLHRITYAIRSRGIPAVARFGNARVFDREGVRRIKAALAESRQRGRGARQQKENQHA